MEDTTDKDRKAKNRKPIIIGVSAVLVAALAAGVGVAG